MRPSRGSLSVLSHVVGGTAVLFLAFLPEAYAQKPSGPPSPNQAPSPRKINVITNENLNYSILAQPEHSASAAPQPVSEAEKGVPAGGADAANKAAEIASLQKQIKDRQKRIELLMHLFVVEEKKFVQSPSDLDMDPQLQAKIRYEQEELRRETTACAQLRARLDALQAPTSAPH